MTDKTEQQGANGAAEPTAQSKPSAKELFAARIEQVEGREDGGEPTTPDVSETVQDIVEEVTQGQGDEVPAEEAQTDESVSDDAPQSQTSAEQEDTSSSAGETAEPWESLEELLEAASTSREDVPVRIKVNGEEVETTLGEALSGYQRDADYRRKTQALAEEKRTFETERKEKILTLDQSLEAANNLIQSQEQLVIQRYRQYDWQKLKTENPAVYAQLETELTNELRHIDAAKQAVTENVSKARERLEAEHKAEQEKAMAQRDEFLTNAVSKWDVEEPKVRKYLQAEHGVKDHELASLSDSRVWIIAHKAYLYDLQQSQIKQAPAKLELGKTRQVVKQSRRRGTTGTSSSVAQQQVEETRGRLRRTGKQRDAVDAFKARIDAVQGE